MKIYFNKLFQITKYELEDTYEQTANYNQIEIFIPKELQDEYEVIMPEYSGKLPDGRVYGAFAIAASETLQEQNLVRYFSLQPINDVFYTQKGTVAFSIAFKLQKAASAAIAYKTCGVIRYQVHEAAVLDSAHIDFEALDRAFLKVSSDLEEFNQTLQLKANTTDLLNAIENLDEKLSADIDMVNGHYNRQQQDIEVLQNFQIATEEENADTKSRVETLEQQSSVLNTRVQANFNTANSAKSTAENLRDVTIPNLTSGIAKNTTDITNLNTRVTNIASVQGQSLSELSNKVNNIKDYQYQLRLIRDDNNFTYSIGLFNVTEARFEGMYTIDLPIESVVVSGSYNKTSKKVVLTLQNGSTIDFSVADLVSGLVSEEQLHNALSNYITAQEFEDLERRVDAIDALIESGNIGGSGCDCEPVQTTLDIEVPSEFLGLDFINGVNISELAPILANLINSNTLPHIRLYNDEANFELLFEKQLINGTYKFYSCMSVLPNYLMWTNGNYWQIQSFDTPSIPELYELIERNLATVNGQNLLNGGTNIELGVTPEQVSAIIAENSVVGTLGEAESGGEEAPSGEKSYIHNIKWYGAGNVKNAMTSSDEGRIMGASVTITNNSQTPFTTTTFTDYLRQNYARSTSTYNYMNIVGYCTGTRPTIIGLMIDSSYNVLYYYYGAWQTNCYTSTSLDFEGFRDTVVPVGSEEL